MSLIDLGELTPITEFDGQPMSYRSQMSDVRNYAQATEAWAAGHDVSVLVHWNRLPDTTVTFYRAGGQDERLADGTEPDRSWAAYSAHVTDIRRAYGV